jgi:hypothetical protein
MSNHLLAELKILRTIFDFTAAFDSKDAEGMIRCFNEDGCWHRHTGPVQGHAGVRELINGLPAGFFCRHHISNSRVDFVTENEALCHSYLAVYRLDLPEAPKKFPIDFDNSAHHAGLLVDRVTRIDGAWKLAERRATIELHGA